jgi:fatty acid desaturase
MGKESWIIFMWKQDYILFLFTLGVGIQDFKKSTKLYMKSTKEYKKSTKLAQICPIIITSLLNWLLVYGIQAILV